LPHIRENLHRAEADSGNGRPRLARKHPDEVEVKEGDSLWRIATLAGVSVDALKVANKLNSDLIVPGQVLKIPLTRKEE